MPIQTEHEKAVQILRDSLIRRGYKILTKKEINDMTKSKPRKTKR